MKRIDILKAIEKVLVQKTYEKGHISHRKDGDYQKTDDGWVRLKNISAQPAPQAQDPAPAENTEYSEVVKQDFESVPKSIKDKMFTIAQQYKAEWAEDSDEDMRSMAEDDVEAISQMLWDNADEETRNSWLGLDEEDYEQDEEDGSNENWQAMADYVHMIIPELEAHDTNVISTNDLNDLAKEANMGSEDAKGYLENHGIFVSDKTGDGVYYNGETDSGDGDGNEDLWNLPKEDPDLDKAKGYIDNWTEEYRTGKRTKEDLVDFALKFGRMEDTPENRQILENYLDSGGDGGDGGNNSDSLSADLEWVNEVYDNMEDYEDGAFDDALRELGVSYLKSKGKSNEEIDNMSEEEIIEAGDSYWSSTLNNEEKNINKSKYRDMRSTPTTKNMGF